MASSREPLLKSDDEEEEELVFDRTGLLNHHNNHIRLGDVRHRSHSSGARLLLARTINLCFAFFALGLCFALPTATLDDLQKAVQADASTIQYIYTARYSGYVLGALLGGLLFDRYNRQFLLFLSLLCTAIGVIIMPFCTVIGSLMACTAITGITMGFLDTGGNVWCLDLWGKKSAPIMQALHFFFALGAFVAPLVAEPFLSPHAPSLTNQTANSSVTNKLLGLSFNHGPPRPEIGRHVRAAINFESNTINPLRSDISTSYDSISSPLSTSFSPSKKIYFFNETLDSFQQTTSPTKAIFFSISSNSSLKPQAKPKKSKPQILNGNLLNHDNIWARRSSRNKSRMPPPINDAKILMSSTQVLSTFAKTQLPSSKLEIEKSIDFLVKNDSFISTIYGTTLTSETPFFSHLLSSLDTPSLLNFNSSTYSLGTSRTFPNSSFEKSTTSLQDATSSLLNAMMNQSYFTLKETSSLHETHTFETSEQKSFLHQEAATIMPILNLSAFSEKPNVYSSTESLLIPNLFSTNDPISTSPLKVASKIGNISGIILTSSEMPSTEFLITSIILPTPTLKVSLSKSSISNANEATFYLNENPPPPPLNEKENEESIDESINALSKTTPSVNFTEISFENLTSTNKDLIASFFEVMHQHRLGKFEFAYVILSLYLFLISLVFLVFLCLNPREGRSRQEENLDKSHFITTSFKISAVILMSLFLCLYVGIQVAVGQLLITFATAQEIKLSKPTGYFLTYIFWGSFALSRAVTIF